MLAMKILIVSTNADEAGAPRHVETIVNGLGSIFQFILVFGEDGPVSQRLRNVGHRVYIVKEMRTKINPIKDLVALLKINRIVSAHKPDIIHCHSAKAGMLGRISALINTTEWIYTVHGWGWRGVSAVTKWAIIIIERWLSKVPRGYYIFVAKAVFADAADIIGLHKDRGRVIYNGVPKMNASHPSSSAPLTILMPARVSSAKDHKTMLAAFERLSLHDSRLILCGAGTENHDFILMAREIAPNAFERISFIGQHSDIGKVYSRCHVVALISKFEALPLSIIEAMSCEKAIIASDVGGVSELVTNGYDGILVRPDGIDEIVAALHQYADERVRNQFGRNAEATYIQKFTERAMLACISSAYQARILKSERMN
jgi:glycosyltransferase involved in cell wall biosynthesis